MKVCMVTQGKECGDIYKILTIHPQLFSENIPQDNLWFLCET